MTAKEALRKQVRKYVAKADEDSLRRVNAILEIDLNKQSWWNDMEFVAELDRVQNAMDSGSQKSLTLEEVERSIEAIRKEIYSK